MLDVPKSPAIRKDDLVITNVESVVMVPSGEDTTFTVSYEKAGVLENVDLSTGQISDGTKVINIADGEYSTLVNGKYDVSLTDPYGTNKHLRFTMNYINSDAILAIVPNIASPTSNPVKIHITYPKAVSSCQYYIIKDIGEAFNKETDIQNASEYTGIITLNENKVIYAWYSNTEGGEPACDVEEYVVDYIDMTSPTINLEADDEGIGSDDANDVFTTSAKKVNLSVADNEKGLGIESLYYILKGQKTVINGQSAVLSDRGIYIISTSDRAGNTAIKTLELVDEPVIESVPELNNNGVTGSQVTLYVSGKDTKLTIKDEEENVIADAVSDINYKVKGESGKTKTYKASVVDK